MHPDKNIKTMFDGINYEDPTSTNHMMEMFYEDLTKHNSVNNEVYETLNGIDGIDDIHTIDELYLLDLNERKYISRSVISLVYLLDCETLDCETRGWSIINLK